MDQPSVIRETHISTVVLIGDRAYKFLKPLRTAFLDHSTADRRRQGCEQELALNRRLAPDVYLGTGEVREGLDVTDTFLVMARMPDERRLTALLGTDAADDAVRGIAREIAAFHARQPASRVAVEVASAAAVEALWTASLDQMEADPRPVVDTRRLAAVRDLADRYIAGRTPLFEQRIARGMARDGHGDLLAEDIFILADGPRILDCLAFDERLRCGDVLLDAAFLAMDLERLGRADLAGRWLAWYTEFSNEHHPTSLAHHYIAYRALVRSKVASLRAAQGDVTAADEARARLDQCFDHLVAAAPMLVLVGGGPGVGKTTLAEDLGAAGGMVVLSSDPLRKELVGLDHDAHRFELLNEGIYSPAQTAATYDELLRRAGELLGLGESVVLDASWGSAAMRSAARRLAALCHADVHEVRCVAPPEIVAHRIRQRLRTGRDASDATVDIATQLADNADPWPEAIEFSTDRSIGDMRDAAATLSSHLRDLVASRRQD